MASRARSAAEKGSGRQPACSLQPAPGLQLAPQGQSRWPGHPVQGTPSSACFLLRRSPDACGSGNVPKDKSSSTRIHQRPPEVGAMECSVEQQLPPQWAPRSPPLRQPPTTLTALHSHVLAAWLTRPLSNHRNYAEDGETEAGRGPVPCPHAPGWLAQIRIRVEAACRCVPAAR